MAACIHCGRSGEGKSFRVLEVRTLHVRDVTGESRVQALGDFKNFFVCEECARAKLEQILHPGKSLWKSLVPFIIIFTAGIILTIVFRHGEGALRLMGIAGIAGGIMGLWGTYRAGSAQRKEFIALTPAQALDQAAWLCLLESAPAKEAENDLTYIPLDERTLSLKNGDLMVLYDLLPRIAVQAYSLLHKK